MIANHPRIPGADDWPGRPQDDINRLISVSGTVVRTGQIKMLQARRDFVCVKCKYRFSVEADLEQRHQMTLPPECPSHGIAVKPCNGVKFEPVEGAEDCHDYQEVRIQEQVHRLMVGSIPRSISLLLQNDLVDSAKARRAPRRHLRWLAPCPRGTRLPEVCLNPRRRRRPLAHKRSLVHGFWAALACLSLTTSAAPTSGRG